MKLLAALAAVLLLGGIAIHRMWDQPLWYPDGWIHFLWLAGGYAVLSAAVILWKPAVHRALLGVFVIAVTAAAIGVVPVLAVALLLAASFALGRRIRPAIHIPEAILLGLACYMLLAQVLVHFPVNYPAVYGLLLAIPLVWNWRCFLDISWRPGGAGKAEAAAQAVGLFPLLCHWAVVLKPETGPDALSMHLATPLSIATHHLWHFNAQHMIQAVIPRGGEWIYTIAVLLGGEFAARLMNLALLGILAALIFRASQRWVSRTNAWLLVGLFASVPVVQMVTGSLYVENIWAAFLMAAFLAADDAILVAVFAGAAVMTKLLAVAFAAPILLSKRPRIAVLALAGVWAVPPYAEAFLRTGNPVFPYMNAIFKSPYYETAKSFTYERMNEKLTPSSLYDLTFHTRRYIEGQDGAFGFQFLLFLPLVIVLIWKRRPFPEWRSLAVVLVGALVILIQAPHMRYLYPAMALCSILFALLLAELGRTGTILCTACIAVNLCFLPASSWIHKDFAWNPFDAKATEKFLTAGAPTRKLIDYLNQQHPGEPVLFLETLEIAGLHAEEYSNSWHHTGFLKQLSEAEYPAGLTRLFAEHHIRYFIAPRQAPVRQISVLQYLRDNTREETANGGFAVYALNAQPLPTRQLQMMMPGDYDDAHPAIQYSEGWDRDAQFAEARGHTISYSNRPGARARLAFTGSSITYLYTQAPNRGKAAITLDGVAQAMLDLHSPDVRWQQQKVYAGLSAGPHQLEIRVLDGYIDIDALLVR